MENVVEMEGPVKKGDFYCSRSMYRQIVGVEYSGADGVNVAFIGPRGLESSFFYLERMEEYVVKTPPVDATVFRIEDYTVTKFGGIELEAKVVLSRSPLLRESEKVLSFLTGQFGGVRTDYNYFYNSVRLFKPIEAEGTSISLYLNHKDLARDRRTTMKVGRAFRHMFNNLTTSEVASMAEAWIEDRSPRDLTLKVGGERKDFRKAYCGVRAKYRNPTTTHTRKSLATSCLHTVKVDIDDDTDMSPAEVYASGDFNIAWLETKEGHIAGRVVFSTKCDKYHAPVYGACEQSLDMLEKYLEENNIRGSNGLEEWVGLNLLRIQSDHGDLVGPYLDGDLSGVEVGAKYIELTSRYEGELEFDSTDGLLSQGTPCSICGGSMSEDEVYSVDGYPYCECCFDSHYVHTEDGEIIRRDEAVHVLYYNTYSGRTHEGYVHEDDAVFCGPLAECWHIEDVTPTDCGEFIPTHLISEYPEYFPSDDEEEEEEEEKEKVA